MSIFHESGVFEHLDADVLSAIEWQTKSLILATDITRQQEFLTKFRVRRTCRHLLSAPPVNLYLLHVHVAVNAITEVDLQV